MTLTLSITNVDRLSNGEPTRMELDRHGLTIGRSPHMDWSLPDPDHYISSTHCEIRYREGAYTLVDTSTNGTFLKGASERLSGPHALADGEVLQVGGYEIVVQLRDGAASSADPAAGPGATATGGQAGFSWGVSSPPPPPPSAWDAADAPSGGGWASPPAPSGGGWAAPAATPAPAASWTAPAASPPAPAWGAPNPSPTPSSQAQGWAAPAATSSAEGWAAPAAAPSAGGWAAPTSPAPAPSASPAQAWSAPSSAPAPSSGSGGWDAPAAEASPHAVWDAPKPAAEAASAWSDPAGTPPPAPAAGDLWASLSDVNTVDWGRGGFGRSAPAPAPSNGPAPEWGAQAWSAPAVAAPGAPAAPVPMVAPPAPTRAAPASGGEWEAFLAASGVAPAQVKVAPAEAMGAAGRLLQRLVGGLVVLLEARARAKSQMGAQGTLLEVGGNNPLKFARTPEGALAQLLNAPERGFMDADRAVEDAFRDLQAHQMATLAAMQGALKATVNRFSPAAIRARAERRGLLAKILPAARDQAMWQAYEREFEGVARGSDEAFMDVFSGEFRRAYEEAAARLKSGPG